MDKHKNFIIWMCGMESLKFKVFGLIFKYISLLCVQGGSAGSESGGSGVDSITGEHNVSGRRSAYGDNVQEPLVGARSETSSLGAPAGFQVCV
jgi:hypothetical protein